MKTLNTYINETLVCSHSEHINEWKASSGTVSSIKTQYFVYKNFDEGALKIFNNHWPQFPDYIDKVYINGKQIEVGEYGWTQDSFPQGEYNVEIKDINKITNCKSMFSYCKQLITIPLFDTSKVEDMWEMFYECSELKDVPLFDISNVKSMFNMFHRCYSLSEKTKKEWSKSYNF